MLEWIIWEILRVTGVTFGEHIKWGAKENHGQHRRLARNQLKRKQAKNSVGDDVEWSRYSKRVAVLVVY